MGLYELLKQLDIKQIEPVVLCYYKNHYTQILETIPGVKVIFINDEALLEIKKIPASRFSFINILLLQYYSVKKYFYGDSKLVAFIYDVLQTERPQLVQHSNDITDNRQSVRACIKAGIPQLIYNHTLAGYGYDYTNYWFDYFLIKKLSFHIHMTEVVRNHFTKLFHLDKKKSAIFNDFVDTDKFMPKPENELLEQELGIDESDFVITDIGRIISWKGQHVLIEAVNLIKNKVPQFKVLIVGPYDKAVGSETYYKELNQLTVKYHLEDIIIFTGNREDISEIINSSDVIVHTAIKPEPQGIVILEALLCKKPVIASDSGGSAELVKMYGGLLVKPADAAALANILLQVMNGEKDKVSSENYPVHYEKLLQDFDPKNKVEQLMDIYKSVLN